MSTEPKRYGILPIEHVEPITFYIGDELFHVTPKPRFDLVQALSRAVELKGGFKTYDVNILQYCLRELVVKELFNAEKGEWEPADDLERLDAIFQSDRVVIPTPILGEIAMDLMKATTAHPTGGSDPSSVGPTSIDTTSKVASDSLVLP
jgi:hypothetical protein